MGYNFNHYQPSSYLSLYQKRVLYVGIKVFNNLPLYLKQLYNNCTGFKFALKDFFCCHSFYTLEEYFNFEYDKNIISL
jgi:hypothetical protein